MHLNSLTKENIQDLERVKKAAITVILQEKYQGYQKGLAKLGLETLESRRRELCINFALKCSQNAKRKHM